jgi:riboflavin biosynthesis pyrimidine reductase
VSAERTSGPAAERDPEQLHGLLPAAAPASAVAVVEGLGLWERAATAPARPRVLLNMVSTVDGRATLEGRSGALSTRADREMFHALRAAVDAVLVGAGTVRTERYGRMIANPAGRELRAAHGLSPEPLACIASASLSLDPELPLLAEPQSRVVLLTQSSGQLAPAAAQVDYIRADAAGELDLAGGLDQLAARFGVQLVLCEGGPHLAGQLLAAGLLDELYVTLSPALAGMTAGAERELRIVAGVELNPPVELELLGVLEHEAQLFLRYRVAASERVSRETIASSSLAR